MAVIGPLAFCYQLLAVLHVDDNPVLLAQMDTPAEVTALALPEAHWCDYAG
jgi:hypothetical protein